MKLPSKLVLKRTALVALIATAVSMLIWTGFRVMTGIHPDVKTNTVRILLPSLISLPIGFFWFSHLERLENSYRSAVRHANEMTRAASVDPLTGVLNRRSFIVQFEAATATAMNGWFLFADIDYLKAFNDEHGHLVGDDAIVAASYGLTSALPLDSLIGRLGGDEFCAFIPALSRADIDGVIKKINVTADAKLQQNRPDIFHTLSLSIGYMPCKANQKFVDIMALADERMYRKKKERM